MNVRTVSEEGEPARADKPSAASGLARKAGQGSIADAVLEQIHLAQKGIHAATETFETALAVAPSSTRLKLIIQIPCYNEESTLGITLKELPRQLDGVAVIEWLVVDDGSTDRTAEVARAHGVDHLVRLPRNQGLARAFLAGLDEAVRLGADIIVNTDADNQYCAQDIDRLIQPILTGKAELVVGARPINHIPHFSCWKKLLQCLGSWVVRHVSKTEVQDAPSGFRAMSRATAMRLNVFSDYTYTLETIIQAGQKGMAVVSVPVRTNADLRPSRLLRSIPEYVSRSALTILRIFMTYRPLQFFALPGILAGSLGLLIFLRFIYFYFTSGGAGHVQSLILGALLIGAGFLGVVVALVADLISVNRKLLERLDWRVQQLADAVQRHQQRRFVGRDEEVDHPT